VIVLDRRQFLQVTGTAAAGVVVSGGLGGVAHAAPPSLRTLYEQESTR
jgi:hypothetical protein